MKSSEKKELANHFDLSGDESGWTPVLCPLHDDNRASAAINWKLGFTCKAGCGGRSLSKLYQEIIGGDVAEEKDELDSIDFDDAPVLDELKPASVFYEDAAGLFKHFVAERGISPQTYRALGVTFELNPTAKDFGYITIPNGAKRSVKRKFIDGMVGDRYVNSSGKGQPIYKLPEVHDAKDVILVEGLFDLMALYEMGYRNVSAALTSSFKEKQAYEFKGKTVFVIFDNDYAGYKGSRKAAEHLKEMGANPIILELPQFFGKDPHEAFRYNAHHFRNWLAEKLAQYDAVDKNYVIESFLTNRAPLKVYRTGIPTFDAFLGGGFKAGVHILGGKPGAGKTMLTVAICRAMAEQGARILKCSYEISKLQMWARMSSQFDAQHTWAELEMNPLLLTQAARERVTQLSEQVRVVMGWNVNEVERAVNNFDVVVVDYIQRMPSAKSEVKFGVSDNIQRLSNIARDYNKIVIAVSSLPRSGYKADGEMGVFKESGDIEYVCQSATILKKAGDAYITASLIKNTRGVMGNFALEGDLGHCLFKEADYFVESDERADGE